METQDLKHKVNTDFTPYLNQQFTINFSQDVSLPAELIEVTHVGGYSPLERSPFSIVLRTTQKNEYFSQGTFGVQHPEMGNMYLFLVPLGIDSQGVKYEAVFG
jgi:hypothetical protein